MGRSLPTAVLAHRTREAGRALCLHMDPAAPALLAALHSAPSEPAPAIARLTVHLRYPGALRSRVKGVPVGNTVTAEWQTRWLLSPTRPGNTGDANHIMF